MQPSGELHVNLLGHFHITFDGQSVPGLQTDRYQSLLAYLMLKARSPQIRAQVASLFWPDSSDTQAKTNLRRELFRLRQMLPHAEQFIQTTNQTIQWTPQLQFWLDVAAFEETLNHAAEQQNHPNAQIEILKQAVELYHGPLVPNCYEDWIEPERDRLQQLMVHALIDLSSKLAQVGETRLAIAYGQQLLTLDPLNEMGYLALMELHAHQGDRATALQLYHQCMTQLREELGIDPTARIQDLYQLLLSEQPTTSLPSQNTRSHDTHSLNAGPHVTPPSTPRTSHHFATSPPIHPRQPPSRNLLPTKLVGRDNEWHTIHSWLANASPAMLLLLGEPGIGKTRLLEELASLTESEQGAVLWGQGFQAECLRPYGAWVDALRFFSQTHENLGKQVPAALGMLLPELGLPDNGAHDRGRLFDAVIEFLDRITQLAGPLVIILDDIQWLDEASVALLHYVWRVSQGRFQIACSARSQRMQENPTVETLIQTLRREQIRHIRIHDSLLELIIPPLDKMAIQELVSIETSLTSDGTNTNYLDNIYRNSGGNPLLALAAIHALDQGITSEVTDLTALIRDRLVGLPETAQALLPWAAALGHSFDPMMLMDIAETSAQQLFTDLATLEQGNIVKPSHQPDGYEFSHDLVRLGIYHQISAPRQRLMHRQIAYYLDRCYTNDPTKMVELVRHGAIAQVPDLVIKAARIASHHSLSVFAFGEARELAQQGLEHCPKVELREQIPQKAELLRIQVLAGVNPENIHRIETQIKVTIREAQAFDLQDAEAIAQDALLVLKYEHNQRDDIQAESLAAASRAQYLHPRNSAKLLANGGACLAIMTRDMLRAEAMLREAQALAERTDAKISDLELGLGIIYRHLGNLKQAEHHLANALHISQQEHEHLQSCQVWMIWGMLAVEQELWDHVINLCHPFLTVANKLAGGSEAAFAHALKALAEYALSKITAEDVAATVQKLIDLDAQRKLTFVLSHWARIELKRQDPQTALMKANAALAAAKIVQTPNDVALAHTMVIQSKIATGESVDVFQIQQQIEMMLNNEQSLSDWVVQHLITLQEELR